MSDHSTIEWTDATWQPITGCSVISKGCTNCYAMRLAGTRLQHHPSRVGLTKPSAAGPVWTGEVRLNDQWLTQPQAWRKPRRVFVCAHGDLFHESVPDAWIDQVFAVMAESPQHTFQVLTKRAERMHAYITARGAYADISTASVLLHDAGRLQLLDDPQPWPLPNVHLGVSAEDQASAEARIPWLLCTPAAVRWVSAEPLLLPLDLTRLVPSWMHQHTAGELPPSSIDALRGLIHGPDDQVPRLDWVVVGGESGPGARPMHPDWARSLRDQCQAAGVPFFFKQWGDWAADQGSPTHHVRPKACNAHVWPDMHVSWRIGKTAAGRQLDGRTHDEFPAGPAGT